MTAQVAVINMPEATRRSDIYAPVTEALRTRSRAPSPRTCISDVVMLARLRRLRRARKIHVNSSLTFRRRDPRLVLLLLRVGFW